MNKSCGGCRHWVKCHEDGLCELQDMRCPSDYACKKFKGKRYTKRDRKKIEQYCS